MVELIWEGKYDASGKRVAPLRVALPFQTVETVNESAQQRQLMLDLFSSGRDPEWRNRLIWGDKKYVLPSLLPEFEGKVDLIYIDPPFATGADFSFQAQIGDKGFEKEPSIIEAKAYRDTWGKGLDGYLSWFYETVILLYELLTPNGSIYVHLDWHVGHYAKGILDEVFGLGNFLNEIVWQRTVSHNDPRRYGIIHDVLFFYRKGNTYTWNSPKAQHSEEYLDSFFNYAESPTGEIRKLEKGEEPPPQWRKFALDNLASPNPRPNLTYEYKGYQPPAKGWKVSLEKMQELDRQGRLYFPASKDQRIRRKLYIDNVSEGKAVPDLWTDMLTVQAGATESVGYSTQKPEALLERIIRASSNEGDLILDCFCGSGTTAAVAEKLNRRWITCDLGRFAIHTARKRLLGIEGVRPFVVQNLGKYERQVWQQSEFGSHAETVIRSYRKFILDLYHAEPIEGYVWLHGRKGGRMVHVGTVDSPIVPGDVTSIAIEFRKAIGTGANAPKVAGVDILGWDFALDMNETIKQLADANKLDVKFIRIPREVLEKKAVDQGDIHFSQLNALYVDVRVGKRSATITLTDFLVPPDDVPADVIKAVKHWSEWIDYWAVDFNYRDDTFHNEWQSYRTRKDRSLQLTVNNTYQQPGEYTVLVKVIDILGNDTTKAIQIDIK